MIRALLLEGASTETSERTSFRTEKQVAMKEGEGEDEEEEEGRSREIDNQLSLKAVVGFES